MFKNLTVAGRLSLLVAMLLLFSVVAGFVGIRGEANAVAALDSVYKDRVVPLGDLKKIADAYAVDIVDASHKVRNGNFNWAQGRESTTRAKREIDQLWRAYLGTVLVDEEKALIAQLQPMLKAAEEPLGRLAQIMQREDMDALVAFTRNDLYQVIDPISEKFSALIEVQRTVAKAEYEAAQARAVTDRNLAIATIVLALLLGIAVAYRVTRQITRQLGGEPADAAALVRQVADGDLSGQITLRAGDSDSLLAALKSMQDKLSTLVGDVQTVVGGAVQGDFSHRVPLADKTGFGHQIGSSLNQLAETTDTGLKDVIRVASALAKGDLTETIERDYPGAFGETRSAVNTTVQNLRDMVERIHDSTGAIHTASREISVGNTDLSQRTEEQASSLEETASSMEELTSTVRQNADRKSVV